MKFTLSSMVLAALAAGQATAVSISHQHGIQHNHAARHTNIVKAANEKRDLARRDLNLLSAVDMSKASQLGIKILASNPTFSNGLAWVGTDGDFTNEFHNQSPEDLILVLWSQAGGSWVNAVPPVMMLSIPAGGSQTVSFASGASGAWAPVYPDTTMIDGQIAEFWGEFTFGPYGVFDVSQEPNMSGRNMTIVGPQCTSSPTQCTFQCGDGSNRCMTGYVLTNCATGSQPGANYGMYDNAPSGGCGGMGSKAALKTYLG